jgi:hypothetical protein
MRLAPPSNGYGVAGPAIASTRPRNARAIIGAAEPDERQLCWAQIVYVVKRRCHEGSPVFFTIAIVIFCEIEKSKQLRPDGHTRVSEELATEVEKLTQLD